MHYSPKKFILTTLLFTILLAILWAFPALWYTQSSGGPQKFWFAEQTNVTGWLYEEVPVSKSAERLLVADRMVNGEFTSPHGRIVRVFSAKRYQEKRNEIGLFVHTPDRCWVQGGWKIEPVQKDYLELSLHGAKMPFERRLFVGGRVRELVYFTGLTGGEPLPYRLDHNLSVAQRFQVTQEGGTGGAALRASDKQLWSRVWDSFTNRRQLFGPKQFIRISTSVEHGNFDAADKILQDFIGQWLALTDFEREAAQWKQLASAP